MAFKIEYNEIKLLILMLFGLPLITATNIDCNGKAFHCVNSTHFMICVDLGSGVSKTLDDFVIPCPPTTGCRESNKYECEYLPVTTTVLPVLTSEVNNEVTENASTLAWEPISVTTNGQKTNEVEQSERYNTLNNPTLTSELVRPTDAEPTEVETLLLSEDTIAGAELDIQNIEVINNTVEILSTAASPAMTNEVSSQTIPENGFTEPFGLTNTIVGDTTASVNLNIISSESYNGLTTTVGSNIHVTPSSYLSTENTFNLNGDDYNTSTSTGLEAISTTYENIITETVAPNKNFTDVFTVVPSTTPIIITPGVEETSSFSIVSDETSVTMMPTTTTMKTFTNTAIDAGPPTKIPEAEEPTSFVTEDVTTSEKKSPTNQNIATGTVTAEINANTSFIVLPSTTSTEITLEAEKTTLFVVKEISNETSFTVTPTTTTPQTLTTIAVDTGVPASSYFAEEITMLPGATNTESFNILLTTATEVPVSALVTEGKGKTSSDIFSNDIPAEYATTAITLEAEVLTSSGLVTSTPSNDVVPSDSPITFTTEITPGSEVQETSIIADGNGNDLSSTLSDTTGTESYNAIIITETDELSSFGTVEPKIPTSSLVATPERDDTGLILLPDNEITDSVTTVTIPESESIVDKLIKNITTPAESFSSTTSKPEVTTSSTMVTDTEFSLTETPKTTDIDFSAMTPGSKLPSYVFTEKNNDETSLPVLPTDKTSERVSTSTSGTEEITIETSFIVDSNDKTTESVSNILALEPIVSTSHTEKISNDKSFILLPINETTETVSNVLIPEPIISTSPLVTEEILNNTSFTIVSNTPTKTLNLKLEPEVPTSLSVTEEKENEMSFYTISNDKTTETIINGLTEKINDETSLPVFPTDKTSEIVSTSGTEEIAIETSFIVDSNDKTTESVSNILALEPVVSTSHTEEISNDTSFILLPNNKTTETVSNVSTPEPIISTSPLGTEEILNNTNFTIVSNTSTETLNLKLEPEVPTSLSVTEEKENETSFNTISNDKTTETVINGLTLEPEVPTAATGTEEITNETSFNAISNDKTTETIINGLTLELEVPITGTREITNETSFIAVSNNKTSETITNGLTLEPKVLILPLGTEEILNDTSFAVFSNDKPTDTVTNGLTSETKVSFTEKFSDKSFTEFFNSMTSETVATVLIPTSEIPTSVVHAEVNQIDNNKKGAVKITNHASAGFEIVDSTLPAAESVTTDPFLTIDLRPMIDSHTIVKFDDESINQIPNNIIDNLTPKSTTQIFFLGTEPYTDNISTDDTISRDIITEEDSLTTKGYREQEFFDVITVITSNQIPVTENAIPLISANEGDKRRTSNIFIPFEKSNVNTAADEKQQTFVSIDNKQISDQGINGNIGVMYQDSEFLTSITDSVRVTDAKESITPLNDFASTLVNKIVTQDVNNSLIIDTPRVTNGATKVSNITVSIQNNTIESELNGPDKDILNQQTFNKTRIKNSVENFISNLTENVKITNIEIDTSIDNPLKDLILNTKNTAQIFNETGEEKIRNTNVTLSDLGLPKDNNMNTTNRIVTTKTSMSESFLNSEGTVTDSKATEANDKISSTSDLNEGLKTTENTNIGESGSNYQQSIIKTPSSVDSNDLYAESVSNSYQNQNILTQENQETTLFTVAHNTPNSIFEFKSNGVNVDDATIKSISPKYYRNDKQETEHNIYSTQTGLEDGSILSSDSHNILNTEATKLYLPTQPSSSTDINEQQTMDVTVTNKDLYATTHEISLPKVTIIPQQADFQFTTIETNDKFYSFNDINVVDIPTPFVISIDTSQAIDNDFTNLQSKTAESDLPSAKANSLTTTTNALKNTKPTTVTQNISKNPSIHSQTDTSVISERDKSVSTTPIDQTNDLDSTITSISDSTNLTIIETIPTQINYVKAASESTTEAVLTSTTPLANSDITFSTFAPKTIQETTESTKASSVTVKTTNASKPPFNCFGRRRGRYSDPDDCRKYYVCIGLVQPIVGICPGNTVFSIVHKQCTKNLSHCVRGNEFQCFSEGRFIDIYKTNIYYICVKYDIGTFYRFKLQCQTGFYLNKESMKCIKNNTKSISESVDSASKSESDKSSSNAKAEKEKKNFECEEEGKFVYPGNCRKYYLCKKKKLSFRRKTRKCDSDELFHQEKLKCVDADSYEC